MNKSNFRTNNLYLFGIIAAASILVVLVLVVIQILPSNTTVGDDNSAADQSLFQENKLDLVVAEQQYTVGDQFQITVSPDISSQPGSNVNVAALVLEYDPEAIKLLEVTPRSDLLALNRSIDNENGVSTIDVAVTGTRFFSTNDSIVVYSFEALKAAAEATVISLTTETQLGSPNTLNPENGYGRTELVINN